MIENKNLNHTFSSDVNMPLYLIRFGSLYPLNNSVTDRSCCFFPIFFFFGFFFFFSFFFFLFFFYLFWWFGGGGGGGAGLWS